MAVRKQCNRYKTEPYGRDFNDVLKRAKAFYKDETFYITKYGHIYSAFRPSIGFKDPSDAVYFDKIGRRWVRRENNLTVKE